VSNWVGEMFGAVDMMSPDRFVSYLTEDAIFKFGNGPAVTGRANIEKAVGDFFASIKGLRHKILNTWEVGRSIFCEIEVTYTRHDMKAVVLPCLNLFGMKKGKIKDYKIFIDISPLYALA
jgi:hypothetical protein